MALADILNPAGDVVVVKENLADAFSTVTATAVYTAKQANRDATDLLSIAKEGGACAQAYSLFSDASDGIARAEQLLVAATNIGDLLKSVQETGDEEIDTYYDLHIDEAIDADNIEALIKSAQDKFNVAVAALPTNPTPGARFRNIFVTQGAEDEG